MRIYLVRHGETIWNTEGRIQGWKNSNLTEKGIKDAKALGKYLRDVDFKCAFTSPFQRAIDTTKFILGDKNVVIISNDNFRELNFGTWEGRVFQEVKAEYPEQHYNLWNKPEAYIPVDGEYLEQFRERVRQGINDIIDSQYDGNILVVTHALVVKSIYSIVRNQPIDKIWYTPRIGNTSLTILEVDKISRTINIIQEANTKHLEEETVL